MSNPYRKDLEPLFDRLRAGRAAETALSIDAMVRVITNDRCSVLPDHGALVTLPDALADGQVITPTIAAYKGNPLTRIVWPVGRHRVTWQAGTHRGEFHVCVDTPPTTPAVGALPDIIAASQSRRRLRVTLRRVATDGAAAWVDAYQLSLRLLRMIAAEHARLLDASASVADLTAAMLTSGGNAHGTDLISWLLGLIADGKRFPAPWSTALRRNGRPLRRVAQLRGINERVLTDPDADDPAARPALRLGVLDGHLTAPGFNDHHEADSHDQLMLWAARWRLATGHRHPRRLAQQWTKQLPGAPAPSMDAWEQVTATALQRPPLAVQEMWRAAFFAGQHPYASDPVELHDLWVQQAGPLLWADQPDPFAIWRNAVRARLRGDVPTLPATALSSEQQHQVTSYASSIAERLALRARFVTLYRDKAQGAGLRRWADLVTAARVTQHLPDDVDDLDTALPKAVESLLSAHPLHPALGLDHASVLDDLNHLDLVVAP